MTTRANFQPDWVSAPGETLADLLRQNNLGVREFALRVNLTLAQVLDLIHARMSITPEVAKKLETALGPPASFWMNRECQYRQDLARLRAKVPREEASAWVGELPLQDMVNLQWVNPAVALRDPALACLEFFGVADVRSWRGRVRDLFRRAAFRTSPSFRSEPGAVAAWLRQGEIESAAVDCAPWNPEILKQKLSEIRALTRKKEPKHFISELKRIGAECGIALVVLRAPRGCRASGATRFLSPTKALLMLSFRYLSDDHFWFSFFHEAAHLLLHGGRGIRLEGTGGSLANEENEANEFAARTLIPIEHQKALQSLQISQREIVRFAGRLGISPGIVVGQLQHHGRVPRSHFNGLKRRFKWESD